MSFETYHEELGRSIREAYDGGHITREESLQVYLDNADWDEYETRWQKQAARISPYPLGKPYGALVGEY